MTQRERGLAMVIVGAAALGAVVFVFYNLFWTPLQELDASISTLHQEVDQKEERVRKIEAAKARLERNRQLSLPSNVEFSRREYDNYLSDLLRESGFTQVNLIPKNPDPSSV